MPCFSGYMNIPYLEKKVELIKLTIEEPIVEETPIEEPVIETIHPDKEV